MIITKAAVAAATAADGDGLLLISFMSDFFFGENGVIRRRRCLHY